MARTPHTVRYVPVRARSAAVARSSPSMGHRLPEADAATGKLPSPVCHGRPGSSPFPSVGKGVTLGRPTGIDPDRDPLEPQVLAPGGELVADAGAPQRGAHTHRRARAQEGVKHSLSLAGEHPDEPAGDLLGERGGAPLRRPLACPADLPDLGEPEVALGLGEPAPVPPGVLRRELP